MSREIFLYRDGKLVAKRDIMDTDVLKIKSLFPSPYVRLDGMSPMKSMGDGKSYDSKSAYYGSLKDQGYRIVEDSEIGKPVDYPADSVKTDVAEAYKKVKDGYKPPLSKEKI